MKLFKHLILTLSLLALTTRLIASNDSDENPFDIVLTGTEGTNPFVWAKRVASTVNSNDEFSIGMALDSSNNVYVTGWFDGTNDFGGVTLTNKTGGGQDIFVAKYNSAGALQWARRAGGNSVYLDGGRGIGLDNAGNIYVTGAFFGTADFDNFTLTALTNTEFFLVKYDNAGVAQWARQSTGGNGMSNPGWSDGVYGTGMAVDGVGNSYCIGFAANVTTFGTPVMFGATPLLNTNADGGSIFLVKYDNAGTAQWVKSLNSPDQSYGTKIALDTSGNVYVKGGFTTSMTIGTSNFVSAGVEDSFIAKFNNSGALVWARQEQLGDGAGDGGVAVDQAGNVYVSGAFGGNPINLGGNILTNAGSWDAYLAKYNSSGAIQWARRAGGTELDFYADIALDGLGNVYLAGVLSSNAVAPNGSGGAMVAKYDPNGMLDWVHSGSGLPASPVGSLTAKCAVDSSGNAFMAGWYRTTTTFGTNVLQAQAYWNYFLAKLAVPIVSLKFGSLSVSNGIFAMHLDGTTGAGAVVDTSINLTNWTPWQTNTLPAGGLNLVLPMGTNRQFFRARIP